jgi:hypothetical protein
LTQPHATVEKMHALKLAALAEAFQRHQACLEDVDWTAPRGLDRSVILSLGTCGFIQDHRNLLITGSTGVTERDRTHPFHRVPLLS